MTSHWHMIQVFHIYRGYKWFVVSQNLKWLSGRDFLIHFSHASFTMRHCSVFREWFISSVSVRDQYVGAPPVWAGCNNSVICNPVTAGGCKWLREGSTGVLQVGLPLSWKHILVLRSNIRCFHFPGVHSKDILLPFITQHSFHFDRDSGVCFNLLLSSVNLPFLSLPLCLAFVYVVSTVQLILM